MLKKILTGVFLLLLIVFLTIYAYSKKTFELYWFIPDGLRAENELFQLFAWAKEGKLPNIKKIMEQGSYGYAFPNFPSHTPTNFATLLTGTYPEINGINDGPMRAIGKPLNKVAAPGFRSSTRKIPAIWKILEDAGKKVAIISTPGSTPPEVNKGIVIRGRWGGWGADFYPLNFESKADLEQRIKQGRATRLFYFGPQLTNYVGDSPATGWENAPQSFSPAKETIFEGWGAKIIGYLYDSTDDQRINFDHLVLSLDKKLILADLKIGETSNWLPVTLKWATEEKTIEIPSHFKTMVIKLEPDGFFRIRMLYSTLNKHIAYPAEAAEQLAVFTNPMVDFVDNFPAQLIYYPEDKQTFLTEMWLSFDWHKQLIKTIVNKFTPQVVIHDIYSPNQMLTSRWWMGYVDPASDYYQTKSEAERKQLWEEVKEMYLKVDEMAGEILKYAGKNSFVVISSDHGAIPLNKNVNLNNLFAKKGWFKFTIDKNTGEPIIDWANTTVAYLKMAHVYINPQGLAGNYQHTSGPAYEKLREQVISALNELKDEKGNSPVEEIVKWEDAKAKLHLDPDRLGDLVIANKPGYGWQEEVTNDLAIFSTPIVTGYKQAVYAEKVPGMWTPFLIMGPGIKKNNYLGDKPFPLIDQFPTMLKALKVAIPQITQGKPLEVFTASGN